MPKVHPVASSVPKVARISAGLSERPPYISGWYFHALPPHGHAHLNGIGRDAQSAALSANVARASVCTSSRNGSAVSMYQMLLMFEHHYIVLHIYTYTFIKMAFLGQHKVQISIAQLSRDVH